MKGIATYAQLLRLPEEAIVEALEATGVSAGEAPEDIAAGVLEELNGGVYPADPGDTPEVLLEYIQYHLAAHGF